MSLLRDLLEGPRSPFFKLLAWRIDSERHAATWYTGEGSFLFGGRWNSKGVRATYCSLDLSTAILEVAVHKGFAVLDSQPHVVTSFCVTSPGDIRVAHPSEIPNPNWLRYGRPGAGQQKFGDNLLRQHAFVLLPSAVNGEAWNLIFDPLIAAGKYFDVQQTRFGLDTRLNPPP